jgi:hypothetical protein
MNGNSLYPSRVHCHLVVKLSSIGPTSPSGFFSFLLLCRKFEKLPDLDSNQD